MKTIAKKLLVIGVMLLSAGVFAADVPEYINYQGLLAKDGVAVNGQRNMVFRLYDAPAGGISLLQNGSFAMSVQVIDGVFNVNMGPFTPADRITFAAYKDIYLEIEVEGELFPRQQMLSVGYAFRAQTTAGVDDNIINSAKIADGTIVSADIQDGTIQVSDLDSSIVSGGAVGDGTITTRKLADGAVTSPKIAYQTIVSTNIQNGEITAVNISNDAVTTNKISNDAVTTTKIIDNAVSTNKIVDSAVTTPKIADGAVTAAKLAAGAIPGAIPVGTIIMWSSSVSWPNLDVNHWTICDGTINSVPDSRIPDLRNRFILASGPYAPGPSNDGAHSRTITKDTENDGTHTHGDNFSIGGTGLHTHSVSGSTNNGTTQVVIRNGDNMEFSAANVTHSHSISGSTAAGEGGHSHTLSGGINTTNSSHRHNFTVTIDNRPLFYTLAFYIKYQ